MQGLLVGLHNVNVDVNYFLLKLRHLTSFSVQKGVTRYFAFFSCNEDLNFF
jgi:hypothetical protein